VDKNSFLLQIQPVLAKNYHNIDFNFRQSWQKIAENCDHNICTQCAEFKTILRVLRDLSVRGIVSHGFCLKCRGQIIRHSKAVLAGRARVARW
jgi:hypothetical protein